MVDTQAVRTISLGYNRSRRRRRSATKRHHDVPHLARTASLCRQRARNHGIPTSRITAPRHLGPRLRLSPRLIERWQIESRSQIEFIERFREAVIADPQRPIWVEKTPANVFHFGFIAHAFPNARLVHVIRDGRDAVCSLRQQPWAKIPRTIMRDSPEAARRCGLIWAVSVRACISQQHRSYPQYWELRYEDLVTEPEQALRALMAFLELPWSERLLQTGAPSGRIYSPDWPADIRRTFTNDAREAAGALHDDFIGAGARNFRWPIEEFLDR